MSKLQPAWHNEVRRLRAEGVRVADIARLVGHRTDMVYWVLDENGERSRARERVRRSRGTIATEAHRMIDAQFKCQPRSIRHVIDVNAISSAARAFAAGEIDRDEMMRRITPEKSQ